jgi:hypothetical protein
MSEQAIRCLCLLLGLVSVGAAGCRKVTPPAAVPEVRIVAEPRRIELGSVPLGVSQDFAASFVNYGRKEVRFSAILPSCGGMEVHLEKDTCRPGERVQVTGKLRPHTQAGPFRHSIKIRQAGPTDDLLVLEVTGEAEAEVQAEPGTVLLQPNPWETGTASGTLTITNKSSEVLHLQAPLSVPKGTEVELGKLDLQPNQKTAVSVRTATASALEQDFEFQIPTSHPSQPFLTVSVKIRPKQGIQVAPKAFRLGVVPRTELLQRRPLKVRLQVEEGVGRYQIRAVKTPPYLRHLRQGQPLTEAKELQFQFVDQFPGIDLGGEISLEVERVAVTTVGLVPPRFTIQIPITGIMSE